MERQDIVNYWDFPSDFQKLLQKVGTEINSTILMKNGRKKVSPRPTYLFCRFCWNESARTPFLATTTQLFSQSLCSHTPCSFLEVLSTTNKLCSFWHSKFQQVSTYAFCSWDYIFKQKWKCSSPNNFRKCTESPSKLSTNTSIEWNVYLF